MTIGEMGVIDGEPAGDPNGANESQNDSAPEATSTSANGITSSDPLPALDGVSR